MKKYFHKHHYLVKMVIAANNQKWTESSFLLNGFFLNILPFQSPKIQRNCIFQITCKTSSHSLLKSFLSLIFQLLIRVFQVFARMTSCFKDFTSNLHLRTHYFNVNFLLINFTIWNIFRFVKKLQRMYGEFPKALRPSSPYLHILYNQNKQLALTFYY